jgi:hypothetical protein
MVTHFRRDPSERSCSPLRFRIFHWVSECRKARCKVVLSAGRALAPEISPELVVGVLGLLGF